MGLTHIHHSSKDTLPLEATFFSALDKIIGSGVLDPGRVN